MPARPPALMRLLTIAAVVIGMTAMHHVVVAACHAGPGAAVASPHAPHHMGHDAAGESPELPAPLLASDHGAPGGLAGAAALCVVILLAAIASRPRRAWRTLRAQRSHAAPARTLARIVRMLDPPDLAVLSVSRT